MQGGGSAAVEPGEGGDSDDVEELAGVNPRYIHTYIYMYLFIYMYIYI